MLQHKCHRFESLRKWTNKYRHLINFLFCVKIKQGNMEMPLLTSRYNSLPIKARLLDKNIGLKRNFELMNHQRLIMCHEQQYFIENFLISVEKNDHLKISSGIYMNNPSDFNFKIFLISQIWLNSLISNEHYHRQLLKFGKFESENFLKLLSNNNLKSVEILSKFSNACQNKRRYLPLYPMLKPLL